MMTWKAKKSARRRGVAVVMAVAVAFATVAFPSRPRPRRPHHLPRTFPGR